VDQPGRAIAGDPSTQLETYLEDTVTEPPETIESSESEDFELPRQR